MLEELKESNYCSPLLTGSIGLMIFSFFASILIGPLYSHYINLLAFVVSFSALIILVRNFKRYGLFRKVYFIFLLLSNLGLGIYLIYIKYGYPNWHYTHPFLLEV